MKAYYSTAKIKNFFSRIEYTPLAEQQPLLPGARLVPAIPGIKSRGAKSRYLIFKSDLNASIEPHRRPPCSDAPLDHPMKYSYQVLSTPTADSPGSTIILNYPTRKYAFGHLAEGTQRAFIENSFSFSYLNDLFVTGKTNWANYGGTLGMILSLADSRANGTSGSSEEEMRLTALSKLTIHGGRNISHMLAAARRFIFRKSLPISIKEYDSKSIARDQQGSGEEADPFAKPTFADEHIRVWAMALKPSFERRFESRSGFKSPRKRSLSEFEEPDGKQYESTDSLAKDQALRDHIVNDMFNSDWRLDALYEEKLYDVKQPAVMFVRNPETKDLERYQGRLPDDTGSVPNITVLVRRPWPAAMLDKLPVTTPSSESICYFVRHYDVRGPFDPKKAAELGLPKGPLYGRLASGETVTTENGTVITPDMVLAPSRRGKTVAIIDLPSTVYIDDLLSRPEWKSSILTETMASVFWILGPGVAQEPRLLDFMCSLKNYEHVVSSTDVCPNRLTMVTAAQSALRLANINSDNFIVPYHDNVKVPQAGTPTEHQANASPAQRPRWTVSKPGLLLNMEPKFGLDESELIAPLETRDFVTQLPKAVQRRLKLIRKTLKKHDVISEVMKVRDELPPSALEAEVITLGTGSSSPSRHRNVSATLLKVPGKGYYLLDCGENTLGQMKRTYPPEEFREVMQNLRMIWISHMHADHHLGSVAVIREWYEINYGSTFGTATSVKDIADMLKEKRLAVVGEASYIHYLEEYAGVEDFGFEKILPMAVLPPGKDKSYTSMIYRSVRRDGFAKDDPANSVWMHLDSDTYLGRLLQASTGLISLDAVYVNHCRHAMGLTLGWEDGFKVSYSGDCRPSKDFARMGKDSTLLIHEATFQDDLQGQAIGKKHSTISEAITVGKWMNAKLVLLTHFSQRYAKYSKLEKSSRIPGPRSRNAREAFKAKKRVLDVPDNDDFDDSYTENLIHEASETEFGDATMPVCMAFDYMKVKIRDIPIAQMYMPAFEKLIKILDRQAAEESLVAKEEALRALERKQAKNGKKKNLQKLPTRNFSTVATKSAWDASESESGWTDESDIEGEPTQKGGEAS